jgi:hypothetical protein
LAAEADRIEGRAGDAAEWTGSIIVAGDRIA